MRPPRVNHPTLGAVSRVLIIVISYDSSTYEVDPPLGFVSHRHATPKL